MRYVAGQPIDITHELIRDNALLPLRINDQAIYQLRDTDVLLKLVRVNWGSATSTYKVLNSTR